MSYKNFFISDTHFGHKNILEFIHHDGSPMREFKSMDEMHDTMIENWNRVVRPCDKVYHLGDVAFNMMDLKILDKCNGKKILIKGNHDKMKLNTYRKYFTDIRAYKIFPPCEAGPGFICSHIPIHPESLSRWKFNVHGHLHRNLIGKGEDPRYVNVSVEQINYTPVSLEELYELVRSRDEV